MYYIENDAKPNPRLAQIPAIKGKGKERLFFWNKFRI